MRHRGAPEKLAGRVERRRHPPPRGARRLVPRTEKSSYGNLRPGKAKLAKLRASGLMSGWMARRLPRKGWANAGSPRVGTGRSPERTMTANPVDTIPSPRLWSVGAVWAADAARGIFRIRGGRCAGYNRPFHGNSFDHLMWQPCGCACPFPATWITVTRTWGSPGSGGQKSWAWGRRFGRSRRAAGNPWPRPPARRRRGR